MLLCILLDLLQVLIITVLGEPGNHIPVGPINLQRVGVLVINMVLRSHLSFCNALRERPHIDWHLINMDAFFNAKLWYENVKCGIKDANNFGLSDDRPVTLCEVRDQNTQEQMSRLFLSEDGGITLARIPKSVPR